MTISEDVADAYSSDPSRGFAGARRALLRSSRARRLRPDAVARRPRRRRRLTRRRSSTRVNATTLQARHRAGPGRLGAADLHHRRHRSDRRARQPGGDRRRSRSSRRRRRRFDNVEVPADQRRQLNLLKLSLVLATPSDPKEAEELTKIMARLESTYGKGKWCTDPAKPDTCQNIDDITQDHGRRRATRRRCARRGKGGTRFRRRCARTTALRRAVEQGREGARLRRHRRDVAREVRHAARRRSRRSSIGCGIRCGRST